MAQNIKNSKAIYCGVEGKIYLSLKYKRGFQQQGFLGIPLPGVGGFGGDEGRHRSRMSREDIALHSKGICPWVGTSLDLRIAKVALGWADGLR